MYLRPGKFFRNQISLDCLGRWRNQSCQIFFQLVHSDVFGKGSNFAIFSVNHGWPLQLLYYRKLWWDRILGIRWKSESHFREWVFLQWSRSHAANWIQQKPESGRTVLNPAETWIRQNRSESCRTVLNPAEPFWIRQKPESGRNLNPAHP